MQHSFDVEIAKEYGLLEAILLNNLEFWIAQNEANETNFHDGYYWTYNSTRAFHKLFPYVSQRQIQNALNHLKEEGVIQTGNYNDTSYDRTLWYAFTEKGKSIMQKREMDYTKMGNGLRKNVEPIPDNKPDNKPNNNSVSHPTFKEVKAYCIERKNNVDAQCFIDHYASNGWKVGRNPMKDWKAAVRTWERNGFNKTRVGPNGIKLADDNDDSLDDIF